MSKKVGLFFGTFNPIHVGHLIIANHMAEFSELDEVWLVVTPHNPHKKKNTLLEDIHRLAMVRIATEEYPKLKASNIEFDLPQPNYTVNTLAVLEEKHPDKEFCLIMGEESNSNSILEKNNSATFIKAPIVELSSTFIRNNIALNKNIKPMLSKNVWHYIDEMNFYKKSNI
jgi:nicotinate-nucleotide adenylyltransferase